MYQDNDSFAGGSYPSPDWCFKEQTEEVEDNRDLYDEFIDKKMEIETLNREESIEDEFI